MIRLSRGRGRITCCTSSCLSLSGLLTQEWKIVYTWNLVKSIHRTTCVWLGRIPMISGQTLRSLGHVDLRQRRRKEQKNGKLHKDNFVSVSQQLSMLCCLFLFSVKHKLVWTRHIVEMHANILWQHSCRLLMLSPVHTANETTRDVFYVRKFRGPITTRHSCWNGSAECDVFTRLKSYYKQNTNSAVGSR